MQMARNSGKDYNDFGLMDNCEDDPEFDYLLGSVTTANKFPIPISMGFCMPTVCNEANLNEIKPYIMKALNNQIPYIFETNSFFNFTNTNLVPDDIHFANSKELNAQVTQFTKYNLQMILAMCLLVILSLSASIISHIRFKRRKQLAIEKRKRMKENKKEGRDSVP